MVKKKVSTDPRDAIQLEKAYKDEEGYFKPLDGVQAVMKEMMTARCTVYKVCVQSGLFLLFRS